MLFDINLGTAEYYFENFWTSVDFEFFRLFPLVTGTFDSIVVNS
jgi:hypothetical protein